MTFVFDKPWTPDARRVPSPIPVVSNRTPKPKRIHYQSRDCVSITICGLPMASMKRFFGIFPYTKPVCSTCHYRREAAAKL